MAPTSYDDPQIELAWRLVQKSTDRRAGYSNRAGVILAADALIAGAIVFPLDRSDIPQDSYTWLVLLVIATIGFAVLLASIYCSLLGMVDLSRGKSAREIVKYPKDGPARWFVSPSDTFARFIPPDFKAFEDEFLALTPNGLLRIILGELYIDMQLQSARFKQLQLSALLLVPAALAAVTVNTIRVVYFL